MVEPANARQRDDIAILGALHRSPDRRVAVERHVGSVFVVEADVVADAGEPP